MSYRNLIKCGTCGDWYSVFKSFCPMCKMRGQNNK